MLEKIDSPKDIKGLDIHELTTLCSEIREYMIKCCAHNPGHLGASLGAVELAVALHYVFNTPEDKLIWDVGHQSYAHKIITGRREAFMNKKLKEIQISLKNLRKHLPKNDKLTINVFWGEELTFTAEFPSNNLRKQKG